MKILFVKETFVHSSKERVSFAHMKQNSKCKGPEAEMCSAGSCLLRPEPWRWLKRSLEPDQAGPLSGRPGFTPYDEKLLECFSARHRQNLTVFKNIFLFLWLCLALVSSN